jgi:hypothetical protein
MIGSASTACIFSPTLEDPDGDPDSLLIRIFFDHSSLFWIKNIS